MPRILLLTALLALLPGLPAVAVPAGSDGLLRVTRPQGESLDAAVARIRRQTGGRILSAETVNRHGRRIHRIKVLLPNGHVKIFLVPAK